MSNFKLTRILAAAGLAVLVHNTTAQSAEFCYGSGEEACPTPESWPDECTVGAEQSPVDAFAGIRERSPLLQFSYRTTPLTVINNGHTTEVEYQDGRAALYVGGKQCRLLQFHFHTTSEHQLGGVSYPMEAHLVHECGPNDLVVVGVLMNYGKDAPNKALGAALDNAPFDDSAGVYVADAVDILGASVNARDLLPRDDRFRTRNYYAYEGSLTTPPCSEIVQWYLLKEPVSISKQQVDTFQRLLEDTSGDGHSFNNRPVQNLNGRSVVEAGRPYF